MRELTANEKEMLKGIIEEMCECGMFKGKYSGKHESLGFMYGISTVMEYLAYKISDEYGNDFSDIFLENLNISEQEVDNI